MLLQLDFQATCSEVQAFRDHKSTARTQQLNCFITQPTTISTDPTATQGELEVLSTQTGERLAELRLRTLFSDYVEWNPVHPVLAYCDEAQVWTQCL